MVPSPKNSFPPGIGLGSIVIRFFLVGGELHRLAMAWMWICESHRLAALSGLLRQLHQSRLPTLINLREGKDVPGGSCLITPRDLRLSLRLRNIPPLQNRNQPIRTHRPTFATGRHFREGEKCMLYP